MQTPEDAWAQVKSEFVVRDIANALGRTRSAIYQWAKVPAELVVEVETAIRIPRENLRPDLFEGYMKRPLPWEDPNQRKVYAE